RRAARHRGPAGDRPRRLRRRRGSLRARLPRRDQPLVPGLDVVERHRGRLRRAGAPVTSRSYRIGVIPGDGTGPEVVREGLKVMEAFRSGFKVDTVEYDLGGDRYLRTGEVLPQSALEEMR